MKMLKKNLWALLALGLLVIAGCQAVEAPTNPNYNSTSKTETVDKPAVSKGIPSSSKGPTEPPSSKGPTAAQAQAITQNENIRLSLPLKVVKSE